MSLSQKTMSRFGILLVLVYLLSCSYGRPQDNGRAQVKTNSHTRKNPGFQVGKVVTAGGAAEIFLRNLYQNHFYDDGQVKTSNSTVSEIIHSVQGNVDAACKLFCFDVKGIDPKEHIEKAEIRIKFSHIAGKTFSDDEIATFGLYDKNSGKLITKSAHRGADSNWIVFPMVETAVVQWFQSTGAIHEVQVKVVTASANNTVPKALICNATSGDSDGVFMVIYTDGRQLQEADYAPFLRSRLRRDIGMNKTSFQPSANKTDLCTRRDMYINTKQTFGSFLIAPLSFNAYNCVGKCDLNAAPASFSNHAMVRSLAAERMDGGGKVALHCCVATNFSTDMLGIMYFKRDGHVILRQYRNMVATECGCR
ncbi:protein decapentaplegic-like [Stylophora pistillata]|uniref:Protein decapentaplegic n=1 Tax=Stylophora pistillata TaxID=50429 RepID=A0A2B4R8M3_STYPI|nr:protein decapentaplegic-like [Stylophora pistillata]PFX14694.1 Protein decapentaplegic [Stylophora pistillata]